MILTGLAMGIGGTLAMDLWAILLARVFGQPLPNWGRVGRWFGHLSHGQVFHEAIADASPVRGETSLGWVMHYVVGALYGVTFLALVGRGWLDAPQFLPVWVFSLVTIAAGWFLMHPGMGLGWAGSKTPRPWVFRGMGLLAHTVFAIGMWCVAISVG